MARYLVTSALPYINGVKHLGNLAGSMLPADVYSRYLRARGHEVLYICGTDEHGTPAELAAQGAGIPVAEYCRQQHDLQASIYEAFELSFDYFGRSSSSQNRDLTQHFAQRLSENGFIEERTVKQVYSDRDQRFLPDRYIVGICPYCGYDAARGDQCEDCARLLDPADLLEPRSAISGSRDLKIRDSRHLFLLQSKLATELKRWVESNRNWPTIALSIARKWLAEGIDDRAITRDLEWGVPVDREGFEDKVYYVWFDAPIEYLGATKEWSDAAPRNRDWKAWWYDQDDVTYVQFMAKDNIPFHTTLFPCIILGSREPWKLVDYIKGFSWLTYYGGKFSTSRGYGLFMDAALDLLPSDYWRYFLIANAPESGDASFTWELFASQVNKDLADTLGNFVNRVLTFSMRRLGPMVPDGGEPSFAEHDLGERIAELLQQYERHLETMQFRKAARALRAIWSVGNSYLEMKSPWTEIRNNPAGAALTLRTAVNLIYLFGIVSEPLIPAASRTLRNMWSLQPGDPGAARRWPTGADARALSFVPPNRRFTVPPILFHKISDDDLAKWRDRFGSTSI